MFTNNEIVIKKIRNEIKYLIHKNSIRIKNGARVNKDKQREEINKEIQNKQKIGESDQYWNKKVKSCDKEIII